MKLKFTTKKVKELQPLLKAVLFLLFVLPVTSIWAASYRTKNATSTNWDNISSWEVYDGKKWIDATLIPTSFDDVTLTRGINVPNNGSSLYYYCKSLTVESVSSNTTFLMAPGVTLTVLGSLTINSPSGASDIYTFDVGQGNLYVDGSLNLGNNPSNSSNKGAIIVIVRGGAASYGTISVKNNISNNSGSGNSATCTLSVQSQGVLVAGKGLSIGSKLYATFDPNTTLKFTGTSAQFIPTGFTYGNIIVENSAGVTLSEDLNTGNLKGNLIVSSGVLNDNGYEISGRAVRSLEVKNGAKLNLSYSNPSTNPNLNGNALPTGFGTISFEPTSTVSFSAGANIIQNIEQPVGGYGNLELLGGTTSSKRLMGDVTANNVSVEANMYMDLGSLNIGNNTLTLKSNGLISNPNGSNYIILGTSGKMLVENIGPSGRNTEVTFPIGSSTNYTPAFLKNTGTTHNFSVGVIDGVKNYATNQVYSSHVINKTWNITQESSGTGAYVDVRLQWNTSDEATLFDRTACYVTHYTGGAWSKSDVYQNASLAGMSAKMTGVTSFSPFSVADGGNPLPVELVYFKAAKQDNGVVLSWETASEKNNKGYEIQASADGKHFEYLGFVASKNGNANYSQRYEFSDKTSRSGLVYYRLKQTDYDGTVAYYAAKVVDMGKFTEAVSAYPNPFRNQFEIKFQAAAAQDVLLQISDLTGKTVYRSAPKVLAGQNIIPVELENNLPAGLYILTAKTASQVYTTRIVKQ